MYLLCTHFQQMTLLCCDRHSRHVYWFLQMFTKLLSTIGKIYYNDKLRMQIASGIPPCSMFTKSSFEISAFESLSTPHFIPK